MKTGEVHASEGSNPSLTARLSETPILWDFINFFYRNMSKMETFLKQEEEIRNYLLNNKTYLCKIKNYYYFTFRYKTKIIKISLKCKDLYKSNILKIQLIKRLKMNKDFKNNFKVLNSSYGILTTSHEGEDPHVIEELNKKIMNLVAEAKNKGDIKKVEFNNETTIKKTIKDGFIEFLNEKQDEGLRDSSLRKYRTHYNYLLLFCDEDKYIYTFTPQFFKNIQKDILQIPVEILRLKKYKNIKYDKIMEDFRGTNYNKLSNKTINDIFKSFNQMFLFFEYNNYHPNADVVKYKTLKENTDKYVNFEDKEIRLIFNDLAKKNDELHTSIFKIGLYTGMRIGEIAELKKENIDIKKRIININYSKTKAGIRIIPIHREIYNIIKYYYNNPIGINEDYLLTKNGDKNAITKSMGRRIKSVIDDDKKVFHSTRKNFTIKLYKLQQNGKIEENTIKRLLGHDTSNNLTFNTYNLDKIDLKVLKQAIRLIKYNY